MASELKAWSICAFLQPEFISKIRMILVFGNLCGSCIIVTKKRMVYGLGNNSGGRLGIGTTENTTYPKSIDVLNEKDIKILTHCSVSSKAYVAALTGNGDVYVWGSHGPVINSIPVLLQGIKNVVDIACGIHYSIAITEDGLIYRWNNESTSNLFILEDLKDGCINTKFIGISTGHDFSIAVTKSAEVYVWGTFNGSENRYNVSLNKTWRITPLNGILIEKVVCGLHHALALSFEGDVYGVGSNTFGQLGLPSNFQESTSWKEVILGQKILDIAASPQCNMSVAMGINHRIYIWGECLNQTFSHPTLIPEMTIHDVFAYYASPSVMHQQLIINDKEEEEDCEDNESLLDHLKVAFNDSDTSDLVMEVQEKPIYVHKAILKIRSNYFRTMFEAWSENNKSVIKVEGFSYDVYRSFLEFLYTNKFHLPIESVEELLQLADCFGEDHLKTACESLLINNLTPAKVVSIYYLATKCNAMSLKDKCLKFATNFMSEIVDSPTWQEFNSDLFRDFITQANKIGNIFAT